MIDRLTVESLALARGERIVFRDLTLSVQAGEALALTGANGSGKTSLLRAVAGLIAPEAGGARFWNRGQLVDADHARSAGLHLLGHHDGLKAARTAAEELGFWSRWLGGGRLDEAVAVFDLEPLLDLEVRKLSAGQRRRLALARLLAAPRPLWLLDEPLAPLDAERRAAFGALMRRHLAGGGLILAAVHDALPIPARELRVAPA